MSARPQQADRLQLTAQCRPGLAVLRRQPVAECAIGEPETEGADQLGMIQPPTIQIRKRVGRLLQRLVVIVDHPVQGRLRIRITRQITR